MRGERQSQKRSRQDETSLTAFFVWKCINNYPYQAFEEAVVNALYHRDYMEREPVEITIEPTHVDILSYAGPDRSISAEAIKAAKKLKARRYRNRRLGDFLKELGLTEGRATGIDDTINDTINDIHGAIKGTELKLFVTIAKAPNIKRKEIMERLEMSYSKTVRVLKALSSDPLNLIAYQGSKKTGGYVLTEKGTAYYHLLNGSPTLASL